MEITTTREGNEIKVVMRESLRDAAMRTYPAWELEWSRDDMCDFNIWTVRIPVDDAGELMRGLQEAGAR